jgi:CBS domain-containing protein
MPDQIKKIMREVKTIGSDATFFEALDKMIKEKTNSLVVVDKEGKVAGMINTGDLIKEVVPDYLEEDNAVTAHFANIEMFMEDVKKAKDVSISKFMTKNPATVDAEDSLMEVAAIAISKKQMRVPVVDGNKKPIGLITRTEVKQVIGDILGLECFEDCK